MAETTEPATLQDKLRALEERLRERDRLAVAFSGGVDSAFLLKAAAEALGPENVLALTAIAVNFPDWEFREAEELAAELGVRMICVDVDIFSVPGFADNSPERCYYCKQSLFTRLLEAARDHGMPVLADGTNLDDMSDYRPGTRAVRELDVASPLREAGLTKDDIRELSRRMGLASWSKPAFACLASRFPYGQEITPGDMERVAKAEGYLFSLGFANVRVRSHGEVARIEVPPGDRPRFFDTALMDRVADSLRRAGFAHVALDLRGYRRGSLNEGLEAGMV